MLPILICFLEGEHQQAELMEAVRTYFMSFQQNPFGYVSNFLIGGILEKILSVKS